MNSEPDTAPPNEGAAELKPVKNHGWFRQSFNPFRIATLRGLAVVLPPLLTIIFFVWAWNAIDRAVIHPVETLAGRAVVLSIDETLTDKQVQAGRRLPGARVQEIDGAQIFFDQQGGKFVKIQNNWIPRDVAVAVHESPGAAHPTNSSDYYLRYVQLRYLKRHLMIPALLAAFLALMYLVGKLLAAGIGRILYQIVENIINRVPIIRNVYSSVKQVTDFVFDDNDVQFNRVVAVEYPRTGIWSLGFVTGDGLAEIRAVTGEPMLSVLMPTSPMPATGFTITVPKSQTIELNLTMDQAVQFCVSCGVVVPPHQLASMTTESRKLESKPN